MTYCVSDVHGEYELFLKLLGKISFSPEDTLISCGDIIDKGKDSVRLLKYIMNMPNARCINGNHEYAFLKYYWAMMRQSPDDFDCVLKKLREYFQGDGHLLDWECVDWIESRPYYIEEKDFICVHASAPLDDNNRVLPLERASVERLVYDRRFYEPQLEVKDSKCVFFGHTPTCYITGGESAIIAYRRKNAGREDNTIREYYKIHLDTGTWLGGVLGCFCVETCKSFYVKKD